MTLGAEVAVSDPPDDARDDVSDAKYRIRKLKTLKSKLTAVFDKPGEPPVIQVFDQERDYVQAHTGQLGGRIPIARQIHEHVELARVRELLGALIAQPVDQLTGTLLQP
jgi:hypothetical protein